MRALAGFLLFYCSASASQNTTEQAAALYQRTDYNGSLQLLTQDPAPDAAAYNLTGKNYFMLGDFKKAAEAFEKAVALNPLNSDNMLWLGRAYGRRAETGSKILAGRYAFKARQYFEKAVALDPQNHEASNDLFDYYLNAPGFFGGGVDKAEALAKSIAAERPAEYEHEEAQLAEKRKDYPAAEAHLRRATELAPQEIGRLIDLARFLAKRGRVAESDAVFAQAEKLAPNDPRLAFARAKSYIETGRDLDQARKLLQQYLNFAITPDDPPKQDAEKLLHSASGG